MQALTPIDDSGTDQLILQDIPIPEPYSSEVLVRLRGALNPLDNKLRSGAAWEAMPRSR